MRRLDVGVGDALVDVTLLAQTAAQQLVQVAVRLQFADLVTLFVGLLCGLRVSFGAWDGGEGRGLA